MSQLYQAPQGVILDQCIQDDQGNIYCPVETPNPQPRHQYASDDNLFWTPPTQNDNNNLPPPGIATSQNQPMMTLYRSNSVPDLSQVSIQNPYSTRPQNIDKNPLQVYTVGDPAPANVYPTTTTVPVTPYGYPGVGGPRFNPGPFPQSGYQRRKPVKMKKALTFSAAMSLLCPPLGLTGVGFALKGRKVRYSNPKKASRYRTVSYTMSILALILIVLGIIIIVLLTEKNYV